MRYNSVLLAVEDIDKARKFYCDVLGLHVTADFGANITLTGGISLQSKKSWMKFIHKPESEIRFGGNDAEIYFEEDNLAAFVEKLKSRGDVSLVHDIVEHDWGQHAVRFYDPDGHIIEVSESMKFVCRRFLQQGMTVEETAKRSQMPIRFVKFCLK